MSATSWKVGVSGDWFTPANWTSGVPTSAADVTIDAFGTYTVTLSSAGVAHSLSLDAKNATLSESSSGTLVVGGNFVVQAGTAVLNGNNNFAGSLTVVGAHSTAFVNGTNTITGGTAIENFATLELGNGAGLGTAGLTLAQGELRATATETVDNTLIVNTAATIAAATGKALTLANGNWSIVQANAILQFGTDTDTGVVVWHTATPGTDDSHDIVVQGGTLKSGDANFGELFTNALETSVNAGAKLDLAGANVTINDLQGLGIVTSTTGAPVLTLTTDEGGGSFDQETMGNTLAGSLSIDLVNDVVSTTYVFTARNVYTGTTTVESGAELDVGGGGTSGTLGSGTVQLNGSGFLLFDRSDTLTIANTITGNGGAGYEGGTYVVRGSNTYSGGTQISENALVEAGFASAIGSGRLLIAESAEFLATANMTLTNALHFGFGDDAATIAATHGHTLTLSAASNWDIDNSTGVLIGDGTHDGTVLWNAGAGGTFEDGNATIDIRSGTLKDGDGTLYEFLQNFASVTIDAGATLNGAMFLQHVEGQGGIVLGGNATLTLSASDFAGTIAARTLDINGGAAVLTGDSTGVGSADINGTLVLGDGGTTGSIGAAPILIDLGTLVIDHSNDVALTGLITGGASFATLELLGPGTTTIDRTNDFGDTVDLVAGELSIDRNAAIGNGTLKFEGGEFLVTGNVTMASSSLNITGDVTFAAAAGKVLTLEAASWTFDADSIAFGDGTNTGKIVWHTPGSGSGVAPGDHFTVDVAAGTQLISDGNMGQLLFTADSTTIEAGATLNIGTQGVSIGNLLGAGTIIGSGGNLDVKDGDFAGVIRGSSNVEVSGDFEITGRNTFTGDYNLGTGATLTLGNIATEDVFFFGNATLAFTLGHAYSGTVSNFDMNVGQTMDFEGVSFGSATEHFHNGVLTISDGTHSMHVALDGSFSDASFALSDDHHGGTAVNFTGTFADGDYFANG